MSIQERSAVVSLLSALIVARPTISILPASTKPDALTALKPARLSAEAFSS